MTQEVIIQVRDSKTSLTNIADIRTHLSKLVYANSCRDKTKKISYINVANSFDIETSSFYSASSGKQAIMYEWTLMISDVILYGRTWEQFLEVYYEIVDFLMIRLSRRLVIYVHNLAFEFQFIRKLFDWEEVFSLDMRKPVKAVTKEGIEFRCSYILSSYGLAKLGDQLQKHSIAKMVGDLDYKLIRHSETPLSTTEWKYCENDVKVVCAYIEEQIEQCGDISKIPLTKTGYVRRFCRDACLYDKTMFTRYSHMMSKMKLQADEYEQLKRAFQGGFTHANALANGLVFNNVRSLDFTSSYPYVMVSEMFPMGSSELVDIKSDEQLLYNLENYCCLFDIEFKNIKPRVRYENPISSSRCWKLINPIVNNGRVAMADELATTITEQDYFIINEYYEWSEVTIYNFRRYQKNYLPKPFVKSILELYRQKTELKGVEGKEVEYLKGKEMLNSCYGMCVTDIVRDEIEYSAPSGNWNSSKPDIKESIEKYNNDRYRFLFYPWGVWVTAYSRRNLFTGISEFKSDYIYSDTDSIKVLNYENHKRYVTKYNEEVIRKLDNAMDYHCLPKEYYRPKTIKGEEKILGVWDDEGEYSRFKTLGAKRYMTEKNGNISITVSGVNKKNAVPYLLETYKENVFNEFTNNLCIPKQYTGKNTHTYIDDEMSGVVYDYLGNPYQYHEYSGVHLEEAEYNLSLAKKYIAFLTSIREEFQDEY